MWVQLWIKVPPGNGFDDAAMAEKIIGQHIMDKFAAHFVAPDGIPLKDAQGRYEVRVLFAPQLEAVKRVLTRHYGLIVDEEKVND